MNAATASRSQSVSATTASTAAFWASMGFLSQMSGDPAIQG